MLRSIKKAIRNFMEKLAKDNESSFGKGSLDCCQLNRPINRPNSNSKK